MRPCRSSEDAQLDQKRFQLDLDLSGESMPAGLLDSPQPHSLLLACQRRVAGRRGVITGGRAGLCLLQAVWLPWTLGPARHCLAWRRSH